MHKTLRFPLVVGLVLSSYLASAHQSLVPCETLLAGRKAITLTSTREMSAEHVKRNILISPVPGFDNAEEQAAINPIGEQGPQALNEVLGAGKSYVSTPAPTSKDVISVGLIQEAKNMFPVHLDLDWKGQRTSTTVYMAVPAHVGAAPGNLISNAFPLAVLHLHGGGTPTAGGKNADKVAENLLKLGVPTIAPDLPGHGRGPRQLDPFLTAVDQLDWALEVADKMLHPQTKIMLSGHSWGAMFGLLLQRLSEMNPRYKRVVGILAIAPGIDPTMGGSAADRNKFEQWFQENLENLRGRIAKGDYEFQKNVRANGKSSDVGALFTGLFNLDYALPLRTAEEYARMIPTWVIVGDNDGVVKVGFDEPYDKLMKPLGNRYIVLGPGPTFRNADKTKHEQVGHQVFDVEIQPHEPGYVPGKNTLKVYRMINDLVAEVSGGARFPEPPSTLSSPAQIIDAFARKYANFYGFRMMMAATTEYVDRDTDLMIPMAAQKEVLDKYLIKVSSQREMVEKQGEAQMKKAVADLRARLNITEQMTLEGSQAELAFPPLTPGRRQELEAFVAAVTKIDQDMPANFKDPETDAAIAKLAADNADLLKQLGVAIDGLKPVIDRLVAEDKELKALRAAERDAAKARNEKYKISPENQKSDQEKDRFRAKVAGLNQEYLKLAGERQKRFGEERNRLVDQLKKPEGISDMRSANRQLKVDRSPERRRALEAFVAEYPVVEAAVKAEIAAKVKAAVDGVAKPSGITSVEQAEALLAEVEARKNLTYVSPKAPATVELVAAIHRLDAEIAQLNVGDESKKIPTAKQLLEKVMELDQRVQAANAQAEAGWASRLAKSPELQALQAEYDSALALYDKKDPEYENAKSAFLDDLNRRGQRTAAAILAMTPQLKALRAEAQAARAAFLAAKAKLDAAKIPDFVKKVVEEARKAEEALEARRRALSLKRQELDQTRKLYVEAMVAAGEKMPKLVDAYPMFTTWNRPLAEVRADLERDRFFRQAMTNFLGRWEEFEAELNRKQGAKTDDGY